MVHSPHGHRGQSLALGLQHGLRAQVLESSTAFQVCQQRVGLEMEQLCLELAPIWDNGTTDTTVLLLMNFLKIIHFFYNIQDTLVLTGVKYLPLNADIFIMQILLKCQVTITIDHVIEYCPLF